MLVPDGFLHVTATEYLGLTIAPLCIIDMISILPYYIELGRSGQSIVEFKLTVLRLFRLLRIFRVFKYSSTVVMVGV